MKPPLPLNYIRSFESAARTLSFTSAAKELGYTQAAISSHIKSLEQYLGWQLFIRLPRSLKLTEMGEAFLPTLREALGQIDGAAETILTHARSRVISISCPISLAQGWLATALAGFRKRHPGIEIRLHGTIGEDPGEQPADIEISVRPFEAQPDGAHLLWNDKLTLLCAPDLLQPSAKGFAIGELRNQDCIFVMGQQELWHQMARALGHEAPVAGGRISVNSTSIALELAAVGAGLVVAQRSLAAPYLQRGLLVAPCDVTVPNMWAWYLSGSPLSRGTHHRLLRDWLISEAERAFPTV